MSDLLIDELPDDINKARSALDHAIIAAVNFGKQCEEEEYTDTGDAWEIINNLVATGRFLLEATP